MEATIERENFFSQPRGIVLTVLAIVLLWMLFPGNPAVLALLAVIVLFIIGLKRPVWAVAAVLVAQFTITSFMVSTPFTMISLRLLLLIATSLILYRAFIQRQVNLGPHARKVIIPIIILILLSLVANFVYSGLDPALKELRNMLVGLLIVIFIPAVTRSSKELKILCGIAFIVITASALIGVLQHFRFMGIEQATVIPGFLTMMGSELRVPGMAESELELAYMLTAATMVALSIYLFKGVNFGKKKLVFLSMLLMLPALYFTYTRSALFALGLGLGSLLLFSKTRIKGVIILVLLMSMVGFVETSGILDEQYLSGRGEEIQQKSSVSRQIAWQAGIQIAMDNPILGIGGDQFKNVSPRYTASVAPSLLKWEEEEYWDFRTLGSTQPHNDYLNIWLSYGTPALIVFLWLFIATLTMFLNNARKTKERFIKGLCIGMAAALVTYAVNAFYHNLLMTLPLLWILAGFSLAANKLAMKKKDELNMEKWGRV